MTELSGLQIFKYLPGAKKAEYTNCKECGCPTCMAFAIKLAKHQIDISKCGHIPDDLHELFIQNSKQPQKTVEINDLKIGGENVLYRHEKTFINKTALAVVVDMSKPDWKEKLQRIQNFAISRVNETLKVDLIITKNNTSLRGESRSNPAVFFNSISYEELQKLPLKEIIDEDFRRTSEELITTRQKAISEKDEAYSNPVYVYFPSLRHSELDCLLLPKTCFRAKWPMRAESINAHFYNLCAKASYYICKYANMLVFEDFDENLFTTLMMLRQNIFTDPQKPLQVESKIYEFNNPDENSIIFMTTNFALTFFAVANELESLSVPSYLIVTPAEGMSVLTAWSAEKFTAKIVAKTLKKFGLAEKVKTRKIIIPGLLAHMKEELEEEIKLAGLDFEIVIGTIEAYAIGDFVKKMK